MKRIINLVFILWLAQLSAFADQALSPQEFYNQGLQYIEQGEWEEALGSFSNALRSSDLEVHENAYYNTGYVLYELAKQAIQAQSSEAKGLLEKAADAFQNVLDLDPSSEDAKKNKEIIDKILEQLQESENEEQDSDSEKEESDSDSQSSKEGQQSEQSSEDNGDESEQADGENSSSGDSSEPGEENDQGSRDQETESEESENAEASSGSEEPATDEKEADSPKEQNEVEADEKETPEESKENSQEEAAAVALSEEEIKKEEAERLLRSLEQGRQQMSLREFLEGKARRSGNPEKDW